MSIGRNNFLMIIFYDMIQKKTFHGNVCQCLRGVNI